MNLGKNVLRAAAPLILGVVVLLGAGCGGIGASGSVSPATFLLPGIGQVQPQETSPAEINQPESSTTVAALSSDLVR